MANKKFVLGMLVLVLVFGMTVVGCAGIPSNYGDKGLSAGQDESEIIVQRANVRFASREAMYIYVDGQIRLTLRKAESGMVIVPNGSHTIYAEFESTSAVHSENFSVNSNFNRTTFVATPKMGMWKNTIELSKMSEAALSSSN